MAASGERSCAEGRGERFGVIEVAAGADVTKAFKSAVAELGEDDWHPPHRGSGGERCKIGRQWAEVCFVPQWAGHSKKGPE